MDQLGVCGEIKAARGAGIFSLTLKVEDDLEGEARLAKWTYEKKKIQGALRLAPG